MPRLKLRLEKWFSTTNKHEVHYFLDDKSPAGDGAYVFGYNPEIILPDKLSRILDIINE